MTSTIVRRHFLTGGSVALGAALAIPFIRRGMAAEPFVQPPLPYGEDALSPTISSTTVSLHYGKHHAAYFTALNKLVPGTPYADMTLDKVVTASAQASDQKVFNQAGQAWNHILYWDQFKPGGASGPGGALAAGIDRDLGGFATLKENIVAGAVGVFGSGWLWLVQDGSKLALMPTANGDNPLAHGKTALLGIDVWEHAYYLDYQNRRADHVKAVLDRIVNWDVVAGRLAT